MKTKYLIRGTLFVLSSLLLLYLADMVFTQTLKTDPLNKVAFARNMAGKQVDFVFLGNSRVLVMSRVHVLEKLSGLRGLNLALDGSNPMHQYLILEHFLRQNKAKHVFLNVDPWGLQLNLNNPARIWCFMPFVADDTVARHLAAQVGSVTWRAWQWLPFSRYAFFNSRQGPVSVVNTVYPFLKKPTNAWGDLKNIPKHRISISKIAGDKAARILTRPDNIAYLKAMLELCRSKGVKTHLYTAPVFGPHYQKYKNVDSVISSSIIPLCNAYKAGYTNFCTARYCADTSLFYDLHHLNSEGVKRFTPQLHQLLQAAIP